MFEFTIVASGVAFEAEPFDQTVMLAVRDVGKAGAKVECIEPHSA